MDTIRHNMNIFKNVNLKNKLCIAHVSDR